MIPERWEHGSDFHLITARGQPSWPWGAGPVTLAASGREALRQLVEHLKPARVWLPDYYCQDVFGPLAALGSRIAIYRDNPLGPAAPITGNPGDLFVRVNTWGLRLDPGSGSPDGVMLVEDHTHDPFSTWAASSRAPYAFASLRKVLPLADGAATWSPANLSLPPQLPASATHRQLAEERWRAMELKARYLAGDAIEKESFRTRYLATEKKFGKGLGSGPSEFTLSQMVTMPTQEWTEARRNNFAALSAALAGSGINPLRPAPGATAFAATFVLASPDAREAVRRALVAARVYPMVLWPLEITAMELDPAAVELSRRVLSLHCDARYGPSDMERVAALFREALASP